AFFVNSMIIEDIKLSLRKWRRDFVLNDFDFDMVADGIPGSVLDRILPPNIEADAGVKLQCFSSRSRFRVTEHDANLFTHLICENASGLGPSQHGGELAQSLAH